MDEYFGIYKSEEKLTISDLILGKSFLVKILKSKPDATTINPGY